MPGRRSTPQNPPDSETPPEGAGAVTGAEETPTGEQDGEQENGPESEADGLQVFAGIVEMEPPARTRAVKTTLSPEQLHAFAEAIIVHGKWAGTGETFNGDKTVAEKSASNTARVWRRELARYLGCEERDIRTRIWETAENTYTCAVKLRDGSKVAMPEQEETTTGDDGDDTPTLADAA